jgi:HEPN domain-containing protein
VALARVASTDISLGRLQTGGNTIVRQPDIVQRQFVADLLREGDEHYSVAEYLQHAPGQYRFTKFVAFHSHQAAENYLKAVLIRHQVDFSFKTHDIRDLLNLVANVEPSLADSLEDTALLTKKGMTTEARKQALAFATKIKTAIHSLLKGYLNL